MNRNQPLLCSKNHTSISTLKPSALTALTKCADFRMNTHRLTGIYDCEDRRDSSPSINIPLVAIKSYKSCKIHKMTPLMQAMWKTCHHLPSTIRGPFSALIFSRRRSELERGPAYSKTQYSEYGLVWILEHGTRLMTWILQALTGRRLPTPG